MEWDERVNYDPETDVVTIDGHPFSREFAVSLAERERELDAFVRSGRALAKELEAWHRAGGGVTKLGYRFIADARAAWGDEL